MSGRRGTTASLPGAGYARPQRVSDSRLVVLVIPEDGGEARFFDFSGSQAPEGLVVDLVGAFAKLTAPDGKWRSMKTATCGGGMLGRLALSLAAVGPDVRSAGDVSPEVWWQWRNAMESRTRWPGQINLARVLLSNCDGIPATSRQAMRARASKPRMRMYSAFSRDEFERIRSAASLIVGEGQGRIDANLATLAQYRAGREPSDTPAIRIGKQSWTAGELLDHLERTGSPPRTLDGFIANGRGIVSILDMRGAATINEALFPNSTEVYSLLVLLVCAQGFNTSVLDSMRVNPHRADDRLTEDPIYVVDSDKPRRGPGRRFSTNTFAGSTAEIWERAIAITDPARETLAHLGFPTDHLFIARVLGNSYRHPSRIFKSDWTDAFTTINTWQKRAKVVGDDGEPLRVTLMRLRLTEQVLSQRQRHNSEGVSEDIYWGPDPMTREGAEQTIHLGIQNAFDHAIATSEMMKLSSTEIQAAKKDPAKLAAKLNVEPVTVKLLLAGQLDTPVGACLDFTNSPFAAAPGDPCPASIFSCFFCANAVATPKHLPKLVILQDALNRVYGLVSEPVWTADFAAVFGRLSDLLDRNTTRAERDAARHLATEREKEVVDRLLRRGYDV
jgi:hypothetical protein